jgi:5-methylthioribose kinase
MAGEEVGSVEKAGEGNMNLVLRVSTGERTFIVKQARPWVEKYPDLSAPAERARTESLFYRTIARDRDVASFMPNLLGADPAACVLVLEDLGRARDFTFLYEAKPLDFDLLAQLLRYLSGLHGRFPAAGLDEDLSNRSMRELNHRHIFEVPLDAECGLDLDAVTPGLASLAMDLRKDDDYRRRCQRLGRIYLDTGPCLLHGDFFPGSWLRVGGRVRVIDPEFCFVGPPEFDLGILVAHLIMTPQESGLIDGVWHLYASGLPLDRALTEAFAGVEIMRRLIGVAQLPLRAPLAEKRRLLDLSRELVGSWPGSRLKGRS